MSEDESKPRLVHCAKLSAELPAMIYKPFRDELGTRVFDEISEDAWKLWIEHSKMIVNEYRLDLTGEKAHTMLKEQCEAFLFGGDDQAPPPDFVPEPDAAPSSDDDS